MSTRVTILGCGPSGGVPRVGYGWGVCDASNPKNRRQRCSILIEKQGPQGTTAVLIDTSPDLRAQLLQANVMHLDGVLYTHMHADHTHGIDDIRPLFQMSKKPLDAYMDEATSQDLRQKFLYCFEQPADTEYPPILNEKRLLDHQPIRIEGAGGVLDFLPMKQQHGPIVSYGFKIGNFAYSIDLNGIPERTAQSLVGIDVWVVDALREKPHPSHFSLAETLGWIDRIKPERAILSNMNTDMDYETLCRTLPPHIRPAFDGLAFDIEA